MARASALHEDVISYVDDETGNNSEPFVHAKILNEKLDNKSYELAKIHSVSEPALKTDNTFNPFDSKDVNDDLLPNNFRTPGFIPRREPQIYPFLPHPEKEKSPDVNVYQQKKIIAQGMMDLALISANASQLRYILHTKGDHPYYYSSLSMIGISLILQIVVGIGLIWNSRFNVKVDIQMLQANKTNNFIVIGVFIVTILNVFISTFSVAEWTAVSYRTEPPLGFTKS